jgi:hypothetical protein
MNERQQAHINYFLERVEYWKGLRRDYWTARMLAARDADHVHPLRSEEEGTEVGSRFTIEECRRFAESLRAEGIQNLGGYATAIHRSGEADERIEAFLGQQGDAGAGKPGLTPDQIQKQANVAASMLQHGSSIEEVEQLLAGNFRPSQWHMISSVAFAQAKISAPPIKPRKPAG